MVIAHRPTEQILSNSSKAQVSRRVLISNHQLYNYDECVDITLRNL